MRSNLVVLVLLAVVGLGCGSDSVATDAGLDSAVDSTGGSDSSSSGCSSSSGGSSGSGGSGNSGGSSSSGGSDSSGGANTSGGASDTTDASTDNSQPDSGQPLQMDGEQGAVCATATDCNQGMQCVNTTPAGQGFCSIVCSTSDECAGLTGAMYYCSMGAGACAVECMGTDDTTSCPSGMTCQMRSGNVGATGYHCQYPPPPPPPGAQQWEACATNADCDADLVCSALNGGFCTATCTLDSDCPDPSSGTLPVGCLAGGIGADRCEIDCASDDTGCPDGMTCVTTMMGGGMGMGNGNSISRCRLQ